MATSDNPYQTLNLPPNATQAEIKQAYRRLAKQFHPDANQQTVNHDRIAQINAAYEILGDVQNRDRYDRQAQYTDQLNAAGFSQTEKLSRQQRTEAAHNHYRQQRQSEQNSDRHLKLWLDLTYTPLNRTLNQILKPLKSQINHLAADPFDDELMADFQGYLETCSALLSSAQQTFRATPNPPSAAGVAANLYHCLNQVGDGIEELAYFGLNYDDHHLHTGYELFRIAEGLRQEAKAAVQDLPF